MSMFFVYGTWLWLFARSAHREPRLTLAVLGGMFMLCVVSKLLTSPKPVIEIATRCPRRGPCRRRPGQ